MPFVAIFILMVAQFNHFVGSWSTGGWQGKKPKGVRVGRLADRSSCLTATFAPYTLAKGMPRYVNKVVILARF